MKAKELAADELLKMATPRPWKCNVTDAKSGAYTFSQADAHLFVRAVNSFEAMNEFIRGVDEIIRMGKPSDVLWNYCVEKRESALALAEGKAVQS